MQNGQVIPGSYRSTKLCLIMNDFTTNVYATKYMIVNYQNWFDVSDLK